MNARSTLIPTLAAAALLLVAPAAAQAAPPSVDRFDRSAFDSAGVATGSGYSMAGATSGELGGYLTPGGPGRRRHHPGPGPVRDR